MGLEKLALLCKEQGFDEMMGLVALGPMVLNSLPSCFNNKLIYSFHD